MTIVYNLATQLELTYSCDPADAVIAAHAKSVKDSNTWDYRRKYAHLLIHGKYTVSIGDFCALKGFNSKPTTQYNRNSNATHSTHRRVRTP